MTEHTIDINDHVADLIEDDVVPDGVTVEDWMARTIEREGLDAYNEGEDRRLAQAIQQAQAQQQGAHPALMGAGGGRLSNDDVADAVDQIDADGQGQVQGQDADDQPADD